MEKIINLIRKFNEDRDWLQFHQPANLAKSLVIEASELLELYQWSDEVKSIDDLKDELAEILNISVVTVNRWENGKFEPTIKMKRKLQTLFNKNNIKAEGEKK